MIYKNVHIIIKILTIILYGTYQPMMKNNKNLTRSMVPSIVQGSGKR